MGARRGRNFLNRYFGESLRADLVAGLTVAVVALPQSMAYAMIVGAPPVFGLYTSFISCIVAALGGSSRHLITGPTNATAIMFASTLAARGYVDSLTALCLYTFLIGFVKFAFGLLRAGSLVNYLSDSVIVGFTAGAGVLIAGKQIKNLLGVHTPGGTGQGFLPALLDAIEAAGDTNPYALGVGVATLVLIIGLRLYNRKIPGPLIACVGGAAAVYFLGLHEHGVTIAGDMGGIPPRLPPFTFPEFDPVMMKDLLSGAVAVSVIGLMEVTAVSKSIAASSGQRLDLNREFMAQGAANMVGALFSCFASSGSFIRSSLNYQSGARTRMAGVFSGLFVLMVVLLFGRFGEYIPIACLAGLLMVVAIHMVNRHRLALAMRAGLESRVVLLVTLLATILIPRIDFAIYLGVGISLIFFIKHSAEARITLLVRDGGRFREVPEEDIEDLKLKDQIVVINVIGAMYFGSMDGHQRQIRRIYRQHPRAVVLRLRRVSNIDSSGLEMLEKLHAALERHHIPVTLCGVDDALYRTLEKAGFIEKIGKQRVVQSGDLVFNSIERSVEIAEHLARELDEAEELGEG